MTVIKLIGVFGLFVSVAVCQVPATLVVDGIGGTSATISVSDLSKLPQQTVKATDHGTPATFEGVSLTDLLAKVALPTGEKFLDVYGQSRLRGDEAGRETANGQDGPLQLVAPGEKRGARWVCQVTALRIRQAN